MIKQVQLLTSLLRLFLFFSSSPLIVMSNFEDELCCQGFLDDLAALLALVVDGRAWLPPKPREPSFVFIISETELLLESKETVRPITERRRV